MADLRLFLLLIACVAMTAMTSANKRITNSEDLLLRLQSMKRDVQCAGPAGRCFNTAHCCGGLICATFDEEIGEKPEVPGNCVKGKDLLSCSTDRRSCPPGTECVPLGRGGQRYCVHHNNRNDDDQNDDNDEQSPGGAQGGLGATCETSKDCHQTSLDGSLKLCCQKVRRGRQGAKLLCDRITPISICIDTP